MSEASDHAVPRRPRCPICLRPGDPAIHPFCSKRCADIDLHRWLGSHYALPAEQIDENDDPIVEAKENPDHR